MQKPTLQELTEKVESGFLGFWIRKYRISYLIVLVILVMGILAVINIPKESSPSINLGMISISTSYPWTNPEDIDSLISDKVYKEIKDIKWIDKIQSSSSLGFSSITITVKTSANIKDVLDDVRNSVNRVQFPTDAKSPVITEVKTDTSRAFSVFVYSTNTGTQRSNLIDKTKKLKRAIEQVPWIESVDLGSSANTSAIAEWWSDESDYDVQIILPKEKLDALGLSIASIANTVRSYNIDQPIGNFSLGDKKYDYRISGKNIKSYDFLNIPIVISGWSSIKLGDIASIERKYKDESIKKLIVWTGGQSYTYGSLTINKSDSASIFGASDEAKAQIESLFKTEEYKGFHYKYSYDLADNIRDDYNELFHEALTTLILVFVAMYLFVGFKDSLFATLTLPLAFLSTFIVLNYLGFTLNFLTNFSLILSFGIAVDTIIVIVQWASAKLRIGYNPRTAIMLALREYAIPIISWVSTTIVVFIPMMMLPWILGKFLAYIPITIFWVLASGLVLALTVNSALYLLFVKKGSIYNESEATLEYATDEERELLILEREGKTFVSQENTPLRIRIIHKTTEGYKNILRTFLVHTWMRRLSIFLPLVFFIFGLVVLAPRIGVDIFPGDDNNSTSVTIEWPVGVKTEVMDTMLGNISAYLSGFPEVEYMSMTTSNNKMSISVQLTKKKIRKSLGQRSVFDVEKVLLTRLGILEEKWFKVTSQVAKNGPPGSKAVGLKLIAEDTKELPTLIQTAKIFRDKLKTIPGTKNVTVSSQDTPGQFIFELNKDLLATYNIAPSLIYANMTQTMNGINVGTIEDEGNNRNILLKTDTFLHEAKLEDVLNIPLVNGNTTYRIGDFVENRIENAIASVKRENGKVQITVDADLEAGMDTVSKQAEFETFAKSYVFPTGISYTSGGENDANKELITAVLSSFFLAIMVIFAILTLQFNSFSQPAVILYSVIMSLPFVMIGLLLTGNKFSLPFGIGFIAFTGIAVNHGIILIDAINENLKKGMEGFTALVEAGSSRLEPMTLTTVTTALGILPIALRDKFWSGMGFTIIFGVISASILTLFVVKGIYYEIYVSKHESLITKFKRYFRSKRSIK
jgi:multidrug efflux pump